MTRIYYRKIGNILSFVDVLLLSKKPINVHKELKYSSISLAEEDSIGAWNDNLECYVYELTYLKFGDVLENIKALTRIDELRPKKNLTKKEIRKYYAPLETNITNPIGIYLIDLKFFLEYD